MAVRSVAATRVALDVILLAACRPVPNTEDEPEPAGEKLGHSVREKHLDDVGNNAYSSSRKVRFAVPTDSNSFVPGGFCWLTPVGGLFILCYATETWAF